MHMKCKIEDIDKHYFDLMQGMDYNDIDFWGINIVDLKEKQPAYKIYHSGRFRKDHNHPLVEFISQKGMLRYFENVKDSEHPESVRLDISLYQRNNENINALFSYLLQTVSFFEPYVSDVRLVSKMKITDVADYQLASLYHVGLIEKNGIPELLKFHFFTRWCEDPNHHTQKGYRDKEYLEYLQSINIKEYDILAKKASYILDKCGGHLWMCGMDIFPQKTKFKIYLKNVVDVYQYLPHIMGKYANEVLQTVEVWNDRHKECRLAGIALALDSCEIASLNLYYHVS